jgi:hypothetical protein
MSTPTAPTPIPTLPITSATAAQAAHIASLTTQLHQLVEKNNAITLQLELAQREGREKLGEEVRRTEGVVRGMRKAHEEEVRGLKEAMEVVSTRVDCRNPTLLTLGDSCGFRRYMLNNPSHMHIK